MSQPVDSTPNPVALNTENLHTTDGAATALGCPNPQTLDQTDKAPQQTKGGTGLESISKMFSLSPEFKNGDRCATKLMIAGLVAGVVYGSVVLFGGAVCAAVGFAAGGPPGAAIGFVAGAALTAKTIAPALAVLVFVALAKSSDSGNPPGFIADVTDGIRTRELLKYTESGEAKKEVLSLINEDLVKAIQLTPISLQKDQEICKKTNLEISKKTNADTLIPFLKEIHKKDTIWSQYHHLNNDLYSNGIIQAFGKMEPEEQDKVLEDSESCKEIQNAFVKSAEPRSPIVFKKIMHILNEETACSACEPKWLQSDPEIKTAFVQKLSTWLNGFENRNSARQAIKCFNELPEDLQSDTKLLDVIKQAATNPKDTENLSWLYSKLPPSLQNDSMIKGVVSDYRLKHQKT